MVLHGSSFKMSSGLGGASTDPTSCSDRSREIHKRMTSLQQQLWTLQQQKTGQVDASTGKAAKQFIIIIGCLRNAIANEGTFIGDDIAASQMTYEHFNRLPPPSVPQVAIHEVDLEPGSDNFARSVDPIEIVRKMQTKVPTAF